MLLLCCSYLPLLQHMCVQRNAEEHPPNFRYSLLLVNLSLYDPIKVHGANSITNVKTFLFLWLESWADSCSPFLIIRLCSYTHNVRMQLHKMVTYISFVCQDFYFRFAFSTSCIFIARTFVDNPKRVIKPSAS